MKVGIITTILKDRSSDTDITDSLDQAMDLAK
jgi:hypothetical protein